MGQIYYDMGMLASNEVVETSATDFVGQYIGHTGPKTQQVLERSLGKVLFIDEAYRLAEGLFAKEAMDELVDCITKPKFAQRLIIILAGYDADINRLMSTNPGLTSRFPESVQFEALSPRNCIQLLDELLSKEKSDLLGKSQVRFDITCLQSLEPDFTKEMTRCFDILSKTASWANARDVRTLAKNIFGRTLKSFQSCSQKNLLLSKETVIEELGSMINERSNRENYLDQRLSPANNRGEQTNLPLRTRDLSRPMAQLKSHNPKADVASSAKPDTTIEPDTQQQAAMDERDPGVTDEVWNQLAKDKAAAEAEGKEYLHVVEEEEQNNKILRLKEKEDRAAREAEEARQNADEDLRRGHEQARLQHEMGRRRQEALARELETKREVLSQLRCKEQANQQKLREIGVCVAGFRWIKQSGGYRCAGGSHWVSDAHLQ